MALKRLLGGIIAGLEGIDLQEGHQRQGLQSNREHASGLVLDADGLYSENDIGQQEIVVFLSLNKVTRICIFLLDFEHSR